MKITHLAMLALLPLAACNTNTTNPMAQTLPMPMPADHGTSAQDQSFAVQAASSDMFEIQSSQMALQKSHNRRVRAFAQRMIDAHTKTTQELTALTQQKGINIPGSMDSVLAQKLAVLDAADRTFDRDYIADQIGGHQDAAANLKTEIANGRDPDMKMFAQNTLPIVQDHLRMAMALRRR